jgi:hypothetical protein
MKSPLLNPSEPVINQIQLVPHSKHTAFLFIKISPLTLNREIIAVLRSTQDT